MAEKEIGIVTDFFAKVNAAAIKLTAPLKIGDKIKVKTGEKEVEMTITSMQMDRKPIEKAKKGDEVGILMPEPVNKGNKVFKV
jgi:putative protease